MRKAIDDRNTVVRSPLERPAFPGRKFRQACRLIAEGVPESEAFERCNLLAEPHRDTISRRPVLAEQLSRAHAHFIHFALERIASRSSEWRTLADALEERYPDQFALPAGEEPDPLYEMQ